jgi:tRNA nucleotidyltransferase (CCA-adding enzyme)
MMAKTRQEGTKRAISLYFTHLKNIRSLLAGKDLLELGYEPGPRYKLMLRSLLDAHLDGLVQTREDEIAHLRQHFGQPKATKAAVTA